ncbi:hypothetical protein [Phocaeicola vulgatus]|uniref:hypothetical protein n=1 Tax=Phocaeicola vulgatus TaxID=821 RepID=UPI0032BF70A4
MELSWGKCTIKIGKLQSSGEAPSSWIDIPTPVENSTKLTPTKGAKKEAKIEGGENEAVKYAADNITFRFADPYGFHIRIGGNNLFAYFEGIK